LKKTFACLANEIFECIEKTKTINRIIISSIGPEAVYQHSNTRNLIRAYVYKKNYYRTENGLVTFYLQVRGRACIHIYVRVHVCEHNLGVILKPINGILFSDQKSLNRIYRAVLRVPFKSKDTVLYGCSTASRSNRT